MTVDDPSSIALAVNAGLDVTGFDYSNEVWQSTLAALVNTGRIPLETLDDAVRRILRVKFELGLFEHPYTDENRYRSVIRCQEHLDLSLRAAQESMTLLKNDGVLPLDKKVRSIALIGPSSNRQRIGSYSSVPYGYKVPSLFEELKALLPGVEIRQEDGCNISTKDTLTVPAIWLDGGVKLAYYLDSDFTKEPVGEDVFADVNFNWGLAKPHPALPFNGYGVRMTGVLAIDTDAAGMQREFDGTLLLPFRDSVRLWVDGELLIDSWGANKQQLPTSPFHFAHGSRHEFVIEYLNDDAGWDVAFKFSPLSSGSMDRAVNLAREADLTILVCGDDTVTSGEGMDRCSIQLHGAQRELVHRAGELGKPSVLVLEVGKAVDLSDESESMNAILLPWFGGELGARAIARALTGEINPSGHLPVSFPRNVGCLPCYYNALPGGSTEYLEGPRSALYPFGHGLSYTTFELSGLSAKVVSPTCVELSMTVSNTGALAGTALPQVYTEDVVSSVVTPDKRLCAFERIDLAPGETKEISFTLDERAFRLMNENLEWVVEPGDFILHAGFSSTDIRSTVCVTLK